MKTGFRKFVSWMNGVRKGALIQIKEVMKIDLSANVVSALIRFLKN